MKKLFVILFAAVLGFSFVGCKRLAEVKATVNVKVVNLLGVPQDGQIVYMFSSYIWDEPLHRTPSSARDNVVTESDGVASFDIRQIDLDGDKTTFHFAVFDKEGENILGEKAVSVKAGDKKELTIEIL